MNKAVLVVLSLFVCVAAEAATVTVDCTGATPGAFTTIPSALATLDPDGPHLVSVSGTCTGNVTLQSMNRVTIAGSPTAQVQAVAGVVLTVSRSRGVTLRNLTVSGGGRAVWVRAQSEVALDGVVLENSGNGLVADEQSLVTLGGPNPPMAVTIRNNGFGVILDGATFTASGHVTIESNNGGMDAEASRVALIGRQNPTGPGGPNAVRNNTGNGIFVHGGTDLDLRGENSVSGNGLTGILGFENATVDVLGSATQTTTVDGNHRSGVALIFNSSGRLTNVVVINNGSATEPLSSGVTSSQNSSLLIGGTTVSGNTGPGLLVEAGGMARMLTSAIAGGSFQPVKLATGGILELQDGNTITGPKPQVSCDSSAILFGSGANAVSSDCKNVK